MTIEELKLCIREKIGNDDDDDDNDIFQKMSLCFNGCVLYDDKETLLYYDMEENSQLELHDFSEKFRNMGNFGMKFVDVSDGNGLKQCEWAKEGPRWRMAAWGLCLEGICTNSACNAFRQQVVIPIGYKRFDLLNDADETTTVCPVCKQYVEPKICGFNNCWWKFEGRKTETGKPPKKCSSDWTHADNRYHYFGDTKSSMNDDENIELITDTPLHDPMNTNIYVLNEDKLLTSNTLLCRLCWVYQKVLNSSLCTISEEDQELLFIKSNIFIPDDSRNYREHADNGRLHIDTLDGLRPLKLCKQIFLPQM
ncbi:unnamed protein product [Rotaria sordida]|uniref:Uncharacterized protein n=1 Tax=Rotaria sordida TaxID=392033 RepID=A0A815PPK9_9BILA|nr:unnamed protein product [Rotaria sordida]CAF3661590.1 unnamed protein product [Rotaria sordida]